MEERYILELLSAVHRKVAPEEAGITVTVQRAEDLFVCVLSGQVTYQFEKDRQILRAGDLLLLPRGTCYKRIFSDPDYQAIFVYCRFSAPPVQAPELFSDSGAESVFLRLYNIWQRRSAGSRSECLGILYQLYAELLQREQDSHLKTKSDAPLADAARRIAEHCTCPTLSVAELAEAAGMSQVHFRRRFREQYHRTPLDHILHLRLTRAKELLHYHDGSIGEIAAACGFSDPSYFTRLFKKKTGYTPTEYRTLY